MRQRRFTDKQITDILKEADAGLAVANLCRASSWDAFDDLHTMADILEGIDGVTGRDTVGEVGFGRLFAGVLLPANLSSLGLETPCRCPDGRSGCSGDFANGIRSVGAMTRSNLWAGYLDRRR